MVILGISAFYHDSAASLVIDGEVIAAAQEERFTRKKHDPSFPRNAISYCLSEGRITAKSIDYIVFYDKPFLKFDRLLETYLAFAPRGFRSFSSSLPIWLKDKLFQKHLILRRLRELWKDEGELEKKILFSEHHVSHAASAFYPSPFDSAAILTMDGVGEWTTTSIAHGSKKNISFLKEIRFPHSIGLLYSAMTYYIGFKVNSGEYKVMGLAPYGVPVFSKKIKEHLIDIKDDGSFFLNMNYFDYCTGLSMCNERFDSLFGGPPRQPESILTQREMDLAASIQVVVEEVVIKLAKTAAKLTGEKHLCLAGGVALNCVANGKLLKENIFNRIWIQPAAGDAGGALGAALAVHHSHTDQTRIVDGINDSMKGGYLGPEFSPSDVSARLTRCGAVFEQLEEEELINRTAQAIADGKSVGWMNGRMEFGPRALGNRSILADPRSSSTQKTLNLKIKYRESFRPFAPSILIEDLPNWFELNEDSAYMLIVAGLRVHRRRKMTAKEDALFGIEKLNIPRSEVPAITHVDYSARIQTVRRDTNPTYYKLINKFKEITGCPILVNTSFNIRGEPIVSSPEDAYKCFMGTELDCLAIQGHFLEKNRQRRGRLISYLDNYNLD
jgi:carbamoyltransferase